MLFQRNAKLKPFGGGPQHGKRGRRNLRPDPVARQNNDAHDDFLGFQPPYRTTPAGWRDRPGSPDANVSDRMGLMQRRILGRPART
jgi:hypothetical protein